MSSGHNDSRYIIVYVVIYHEYSTTGASIGRTTMWQGNWYSIQSIWCEFTPSQHVSRHQDSLPVWFWGLTRPLSNQMISCNSWITWSHCFHSHMHFTSCNLIDLQQAQFLNLGESFWASICSLDPEGDSIARVSPHSNLCASYVVETVLVGNVSCWWWCWLAAVFKLSPL